MGLGEFSWHELATTDYEAAFAFYSEVFGWKKNDDMDMGEGGLVLVTAEPPPSSLDREPEPYAPTAHTYATKPAITRS